MALNGTGKVHDMADEAPNNTSEATASSPKETSTASRPAVPPASSEAVRKSMQGNKGKNTKPELKVREALRKAGLTGYRLHWKVPGHPDVAWPGKKTAVMVNGCFWHRCPHCNPPRPKNNIEYWSVKFDRNVERDAENLAALEAAGWNVHVVWECQLKRRVFARTMADLIKALAPELGKVPDADYLAELERTAADFEHAADKLERTAAEDAAK